jgi:hypothetical protein
MLRFILSLALCLSFSPIAAAQHVHTPAAEPHSKDVIGLALFPERSPEAGSTIRVIAQLTRNGKPLADDELKVVHTQKFHLLIVDPTLTDYHHVHPQPTPTPGSYRFDFTPKFDGHYRAWADITPRDGDQHFAWKDVLEKPPQPAIDKKESDRADVGGYRFSLSCDTAPTLGKETMCSVTVTDQGDQPIKTLEPVMGAYGHLVGFYDDYETVLHAHPMSEEPKGESARGGPTLTFHLAPERAGFVRLFLQVKISGQELFVPFGITFAAA